MPGLVTLTSSQGNAQLSVLGAQVISATLSGREILWVTPRPAVPLRGGVPICFPWFSTAAAPAHGFARRLPWALDSSTSDRAVLVLRESPKTLAMWPHRFRATLSVSIGSTLDVGFEVTNTDTAPFQFTYALHTYFLVADLPSWRLHGLGTEVSAAEPIDAVYEHAPDLLTFDGLYVESANMPSAVVWNPGANEAVDIGSAYRDFVCVERGRIGSAAVSLDPGGVHRASMRVGLVA